MAPAVSIILPTYQEAENIGRMLEALRDALQGIHYQAVVVDDNSPDGTADVARRADPLAKVVVRTTERGLGTAVVEGFRQADAAAVLVMDADFQHPLEAVRRVAQRITQEDLDLVVGTRYADGGDDGSFSAARRFVSKGAATLGRLALPPVRQFGITDPMSGLFAVRKDALDLEALRPQGYKILLEVLAKGRLERVGEVGYAFQSRQGGESKLGAQVMLQYLVHLMVLGLGHPDNHRIARFGMVGASGVIVNLGVLWLLVERAGWHYAIAAAIAIESSILSNFLLNDRFTFHDRRSGGRLGRLARFNGVSLAAMVLNLTVLLFLAEILRVHYLFAEAVAIVAAFTANYSGNLKWTYGGVDRFRLRHALRQVPSAAYLAPLLLGAVATGYYAHDLDAIDEIYFDEHYYVSVARQIDNGIWHDPCWSEDDLSPRPLNYEHPPLAKLIMGWSVEKLDTSHWVFPGCRQPDSGQYEYFLNDAQENGNPYAWRLPSAVFGGLTVAGIAWAATRLFDRSAGWIAGLLVMADTLILGSSRIALLDIFATGFAALALAAATHPTKRGIAAAAILLGLGFASKYPVIFLGLPVLAVSLWCQRQAGVLTRRRFDATLATMVLVPLGIWIISFWPWWRLWIPDMGLLGAMAHLAALTADGVAWTAAGQQVHVDSSQPSSWFQMATPVMYYSREGAGMIARVYAIGNPILWWGGALAMLGALASITRWKHLGELDWRYVLAALPAIGAYGGFLLLSRTAFLFYMTLVVPFLALAATGAIMRFKHLMEARVLTIIWMAAVLAAFAWFEPVVVARDLTQQEFDRIFDLFPWIDP